jgi:small multidrug resistance pump
MAQFWLLLTVITDIAATWALKLSKGCSLISWVLLAVLGYGLSKYFFSLTIEKVSLGYAYTVWCGLGTLLACLVSSYYFKEPLSWGSWLGIAFIILGIALVEYFSSPTS